MSTRYSKKYNKLAKETAELAMAAPQVVAQRVTRMALAGSNPSERDKKEFQQMFDEKNMAFGQAWSAMLMESMLANQRLTASMWGYFLNPFSSKNPSAEKMAMQAQNAALDVLGKGLAPVRRKAVANAKRLAKTKLR